jgi:type I restriction enzyme S subunit
MAGRYKPYSEYKDSGVELLPRIPSHWSVMQLKRSVDCCVNGIWGGEPEGDENDTIVLRVADFERSRLTVKDEGYTYRKIELKEKTRRALKFGDLLLEKSGGGEKTLVGQVVIFDKEFAAVTSNFVAKMTPSYGFHSRYLNYMFSRFYSDNINYCSIKQNTGIQNLDSESYLSEKFGFPTESEQIYIANFLDHETAKIDTLIEKQQQLIQLLKEKRQAVISHAVTKGLSSLNGGPNAKLRDSGIEWLGQVPEHWDVVAIKHAVEIPVTDGPHETPEFLDNGVPFISAEAVSSGKIDFDKIRAHISEEDNARYSKKYSPKKHDIYMVKSGATTGVTAIVEADARFNIWSPLAVIRCKQDSYPYFVLNFLRSLSFQQAVELNWSFGTQQNIGMGVIENLYITRPPIAESELIAGELVKKCAKYDELIDLANKQIELSQERRTALISAAVTGKIDVRDWVAPLGSRLRGNDANKEVAA